MPFGENIEKLRHSWVMMAEAFGLSILDFEGIPEPGHEREEDPVASILDKGIKEMGISDRLQMLLKNIPPASASDIKMSDINAAENFRSEGQIRIPCEEMVAVAKT